MLGVNNYCLHAANIFLNTNSILDNRSSVMVDMAVTETGSLPNQSAAFHAYGIGTYLYFGGTQGMSQVLAAYDADPIHRKIIERARRATEIWRYIGINKWVSSAGPDTQICTTDHGDAKEILGGNHWAQGMMDALFKGQGHFFFDPLVP